LLHRKLFASARAKSPVLPARWRSFRSAVRTTGRLPWKNNREKLRVTSHLSA